VRGVQHQHGRLGARACGDRLMRPGGSQEPESRFLNYYRCGRCGGAWTDEWSAECDDDCPYCGVRHISPYKSEDVPSERI
jgi:DNA-directed RNA polymerase subunit RPC12/RpoP